MERTTAVKLDPLKFLNSLPYASEMFGIYQPLLGWKSQRIRHRFWSGIKIAQYALIESIASHLIPDANVKITDFTSEDVIFQIDRLNAAKVKDIQHARSPMLLNSYVFDLVARTINDMNMRKDDDTIWNRLATPEAATEILRRVSPLLQDNHQQIIKDALGERVRGGQFNFAQNADSITSILNERVERESLAGGVLNYLYEGKRLDLLKQLFFPEVTVVDLAPTDQLKDLIDPTKDFIIDKESAFVSLSPIGIVHLFREYFFEFDTFLGSPVQHIWLSPGATLELIEIHTRKQIVERTVESSLESIQKSEKSQTQEDEISEAVRNENQSNTKFGMSVNAGASVSGGTPGIYSATGHVDSSTSYSLENNQKTAKEATHKQMRQQSDKLSSEIKQNFKSTFKTVSEVQDTSSKRYVLQNTTQQLLNYELRRKMRQVGVQVQDIGTQLCWQTYVDLPGNDLGLGNLVHVAQPPDLSGLPQPQRPPTPDPISKDFTLKIFFQGWVGDNDTNNTYIEHAPLSDEGWAITDGAGADKIHINYGPYDVERVPGYELTQVIYVGCVEGKIVDPQFIASPDQFRIHLKKVNFDGDWLTLNVKLTYSASASTIDKSEAKYAQDLQQYDKDKAQLAQDAFVKAARERIKFASNIEPRKFEELREEERTIVYRHLITSLLNVGVALTSTQIRHVMAELITSMFDVDQMLYFVAPDWWMPRDHRRTLQNVAGSTHGHALHAEDVVSWGGAAVNYRPNYYITEDSTPARLGSSLGWLLQLDGDNLRNAFLNAPWVKAVIPIRLGKEMAALNWLLQAHVEGADGVDGRYQESSQEELKQMINVLENHLWEPGDNKTRYANFSNKILNDPANFFVTIRDALTYLALRIQSKDLASKQVKTEVIDGKATSYLPTEKVYEHGFDPLIGGFQAATTVPFAIFDQWVEILPTDQIVAVEVKYDPKTGMQV